MIECALDEDNCMDLLAVLRVMNQVGQEQAWGIAYELAALMQRLWPAGNCSLIEDLAQIHIHREGFIHEKTLLRRTAATTTATQTTTTTTTTTTPTTNTTTTTTNATTKSSDPKVEDKSKSQTHEEQDYVSSLGRALFWVLDFGIPDDEERKLSTAMEYLIFQSQYKLTLDEILDICTKRLPIPTRAQADVHYREVCKSLVSDTIKLSIFLDKIYTATLVLSGAKHLGSDKHEPPHKGFDDLSLNDWARLWMQVIKELRQTRPFSF